MGDKISALPAATSVDGTELIPIVQGGATKKVTGLILRNPAGVAGGDLTGTYPNPTLASVTTAQTSVGSGLAIPVLTVDAKGRVTALTTATNPALTTNQIAGLSTTAPATLAPSAVVGTSAFAARADHQHAYPTAANVGALAATAAAGGDLVGNYPNPTLAAVTTAQSNVGSGLVIPVISTDAKGRVVALTTVACPALTTAQIAGLSTVAPAALATSAVIGLSTFAARADHQHVLPTVGQIGALSGLTGDITATGPGTVAATLASITTAQSNVGSSTVVPVLSIDAKGRVTALGSTPISGTAGGTVTSITAGTGLSGGTITGSGTIAIASVTTAQSGVGSATQIPVLSINDQGQVTALSVVTASGGTSLTTTAPAALATAAVVGLSTEAARADHQHIFPTPAQIGALTTAQIAGLSTVAPSALATSAVIGLSAFAARADHQHVFPTATQVGALGSTAAAGGDLTGNFPNPTLAAITTAQSAVGSGLVIPVISTDAKGRVTALTTIACSALTTAQIAGLSTTAPAALATAAVVGLSAFAARADHQHVFPTAVNVGALAATAAAGGDLTGNYPNPTLAAITTAQSNVGSSTVVPVLSIDAKGRVTALASASISASVPSVNIQTFTSSGTWTKPAGAKVVQLTLIGAGGGGGSGRKGDPASGCTGGAGGGGGAYTQITLNAAALSATETVTVPAGAFGGAAITTVSTNGNVGGFGGSAQLGTLRAGGAAGGGGGVPFSVNGGVPSIFGMFGGVLGSGSYGGSSNNTTQGGSVASGNVAPSGGGGGGGITTANVFLQGGQSGLVGYSLASGASGGSTAGAAGSAGPVYSSLLGFSSSGGGGGAGNPSGDGGAGGTGGTYGGGGGGGGASSNANNSGAGGNGGPGLVIVTTYF